jgi:3'-5' exoribonuclease
MAKIFIAELLEGQPVTSFFQAKQVQLRQRKSGEPYLALVLGDRTGDVPAVVWDGIDDDLRRLADGEIVKVQAVLGSYHGEPQLTVQRLRRAGADEFRIEDFFPRSDKDPAALLAQLDGAVEGMRHAHLRGLLRDLLADPGIRDSLAAAPAAKGIHHAVLGGLLEHTASVVGLCALLADYYPAVDRDLLIAGAILHDLGKIRELTWERVFDYTDAGRLLGHIALGALLVEERIRARPDFPPEVATRLLHCILSHHGELEWGSPKRPKTLEAIVLHYAENLDGKIAGFLEFSRRAPDPQHPGWTQFNKAMDRYLFFGTPADEPAQPGEDAPSDAGRSDSEPPPCP